MFNLQKYLEPIEKEAFIPLFIYRFFMLLKIFFELLNDPISIIFKEKDCNFRQDIVPLIMAWWSDQELIARHICDKRHISKGVDRVEEEINLLYERFKSKIEAVSGECYRVESLEQAKELVSQLLKNKGVQSVATVSSPLIQSLELADQLPKKGITVYKERYQEVTQTVGAGITEVRWAIAELGTLVQYSDDVNERLCSSFTPIHIALIQTSYLLPNILKAMEIIHREPQIPGFVGFITGPSRTSDIERVLTIGVHGPEQLIAVFVDEQAGEVQ